MGGKENQSQNEGTENMAKAKKTKPKRLKLSCPKCRGNVWMLVRLSISNDPFDNTDHFDLQCNKCRTILYGLGPKGVAKAIHQQGRESLAAEYRKLLGVGNISVTV